MTSKPTIGQRQEFSLHLADTSVVARYDGPEESHLDDPAAAVAAALAEPIGFPALSQAVVPGDQVALVVDPSLPQAEPIVATVIEILLKAGIASQAITVVRGEFDSRDLCRQLAPSLQEEVILTTHNPACRDDLAYVAATKDGKPVYVNRAIVDADFALPIGMLRAANTYDYHGIHAGWFPEFSDQETIERYRAPSSVESPVQRRRRRDEAEQSAWLLGLLMTLQVVPAGGDQLLHVLAGNLSSVAGRGGELCDAAWNPPIDQTASLVVATIEGDSVQQTWSNVARALATATAFVEDHGAIALQCNISSPPGDVLRHITEQDDDDEGLAAAARKIRRHRDRDAVLAAQLVRTLQTAKVYLLSQLDQSVVESMGMVYVTDADEIVRLSHRHPSCILLENAHLVVPHFVNEDLEEVAWEDDEPEEDESKEDDSEDGEMQVDNDASDSGDFRFDDFFDDTFSQSDPNSPGDD